MVSGGTAIAWLRESLEKFRLGSGEPGTYLEESHVQTDLVLDLKLDANEKKALVAFMRQL